MILAFFIYLAITLYWRRPLAHLIRYRWATAISFGFSLIVAFISVFSIYPPYNPFTSQVLSYLSYPFYLTAEYGPMELISNIGNMTFTLNFDGLQVSQMKYKYQWMQSKVYLDYSMNDVTLGLFFQLFMVFVLTNLIGTLLGFAAYYTLFRREAPKSIKHTSISV